MGWGGGRAVITVYIYYRYIVFSDRVGLPLHNTPFPGVLMKSIIAAFFRPDTLPDVNHMRGMQYVDGNASKPLFSKVDNFQETQKNDFKSSYFFLICNHLHNDATLGCKYSVYIENFKNLRILDFSII